ncbi:E3 ubiquitin-protein ligase TRIM11-like [Pelodiscus sinensis]|uniref:E3 ubiquitin-protein ligase TRIM11-like n=1 Tax=Pelodiscus sinensis TaxID=13735 RepID=UPI003F6CF4DB
MYRPCQAKLLNILSHLQEEEKSPEWKDVQSALSRIKGKDAYDPPDLQDIPQEARADVTLDPDTANPRLLVSADHKSVDWTVERIEKPPSGKRFDLEPCVLGSEGFTSGTHYWEVDLGDGGGLGSGGSQGVCEEGRLDQP